MKRLFLTLCSFLSFTVAHQGFTQTISFWHIYPTGSSEELALIQQIIPRFEEEHPDIKVNAVPFGDNEELLAYFADGLAPNVVRMDILWVPVFAALGALEPLDGYKGFGELSESVFPAPLATSLWEGHHYGLPLATNTQVMIYNQDVLAELGMPAPSTLDDFEAFAKAASEENERWAHAMPGPFTWHLLPWVWSGGGAITNPEITQASGYLNSPDTVQVLQRLIDLYEEGYLAPTLVQTAKPALDGVVSGEYAATQDGPWAFGSLGDLNVTPALMPAGQGGSVSVVGGEDVVMFSSSDDKEASWAFMRFLLSPWAQKTMAEAGQVPVLTSALNDPYFAEHPYYSRYLEQLETARARPPHPAYGRIDEIIQNAFQRAVAGDIGLQEALDEAAAEIDDILR